MTGATCELCGTIGYCEKHHIIFRSQATYMRNVKINQTFLCQNHHRGSTEGVHHNKGMDLKLKKQLQNKYYTMFSAKFYSKEEIQKALECSDFDTTLIVKKLTCYRFGYEKEQLIRRLLGGRMY